jgi:hypothetical protein
MYFNFCIYSKTCHGDGCQRFMLVILTMWEAEIGRIKAQGQLGQIVHENPSPK